MRPRCRLVAFVALVAMATLGMAAAQPARADDAQGDLEKARSAYVAHKYEDAERRLRALLDAKIGTLNNADSIADARMYLGAVLLAESKRDEATATFEKLLLDKPDYQPDPLRVSLEAIDTLIDTRTRLAGRLAEIQAERVRTAEVARAQAALEQQRTDARLAMLEQLARQEVVIEKHSRWVALLPFGVGQFQNGQATLGYTLLAGEALLGTGSIVGAALTLYNASQTQDAVIRNDGTAPGYNVRAQEAAWVGDVFGGAFLLAAVVGVVHAELTFVPERTTVRIRPLPPVTFAPMLGPGGLGIAAVF